ncbi:MAG: DEAD/DEAH box helicase, partial [Odoribacter splanchnicus]
MRFDEVNLDENVLQGIEAMNFQEMTPVQEQTIPVILEGKDIIGCAQTGTGKTAAYTLPLLSRLVAEGNPDNQSAQSSWYLPGNWPNRSTCNSRFSYFLPISTTVSAAEETMPAGTSKRRLLMGADVVIATPGRLLSHIANSGIDLSQVSYFILDKPTGCWTWVFDDIMQIVKQMPTKRQTILFSATLPPKIRQLAKQILKDPAEINIAISKPNEAIIQSAYICYETQKMAIIQELFSKPNRKKTIIFSSSKQKVKDLAYSLKRMKLNVAAMHSDLEQEQREAVMLDFKNGKTDILVATDIVARGIDIDDIGLVINYDVPHDPEDYIHRIGRTARANADGVAITFVCEPEQGKFHKIEEFIEKDIYKIPLPPTVGPGPAYNP